MNKIDFILSHFQIDKKSADLVLTKSQKEIFAELIYRKNKRLHIESATQYGKSLVIALACVWIACIQDEVVAVIAPTGEKSKIILRYFLEHIGDNILFYSQLEANTRLERLRKEQSKERIMLRSGGGIFSLSTNEGNFGKSIESVMGTGSKITIQDESCLIRDMTEATIFRMIAGKGDEAFYCKIGNPFYSEPPYSHFFQSSQDPDYKKYHIDYKLGLKEGRYTESFIRDAKKKPLFDILFDCKFPDPNQMDDKGFRRLIEKAWRKGKHVKLGDNKKLGVDVGGGGDLSVYVGRGDDGAKVCGFIMSKEIMDNVVEIEKIVKKYGFKWKDVRIDDTGIGNGLSSRLREKGYPIKAVVVGEQARKSKRFVNLKAELCFKMKDWLFNGGILQDYERNYESVWEQLKWFKFKVNSERRIQTQPKLDLKKEHNGVSPDFADALMLTFYEPPFIGVV